jgi:P-type Cu2+ transporter
VLAAAVMAGSSIVVVLNSLRLERLPDPVPLPIPEQQSATEAESASTPRGAAVSVIAGQAVQAG